MSDTSVYVIANITIEDASKYRQYEKGFFPILKKFGGEIEKGELTIEEAPRQSSGQAKSSRLLPAGIFARWCK